MKYLILTLTLCLLMLTNLSAQIKMPQPSPKAQIMQKVGLAEVTITYSRPSTKGRKIFGDVVPFDKVWRTGANSPTKIKFDDEVIFEGNKVPAGEYTIVSIPSKTEWTLIINKDTKGNGASTYQESDDVIRLKLKPSTTANAVETFAFNFVDIGNNFATVEMTWEKTAVRFRIENEITSKIEKQITAQLNPSKDAGVHSQIAGYYLDTNQKLPEALELITKSTDVAPFYWTLLTKAKIQHKLGKNQEAITTAQKSIELAKADKDDAYVKMNEQLIETIKKSK